MKKAFLVFLALIMISSVAVAEGAYINIGDYNESVIALHQKLSDLGYFSLRPESPWSEKSASALKNVQYVLGLDETGIVADRTQYDSIMALDENDPMFKIKTITAIDEYLSCVKDNGFTVFIAVRDEASNKLKDSTKEILKSMGLQLDWNDNRFRKAYIAVIENENHVIEEITAETTTGPALTTSGSVAGVEYNILSAGAENDGGKNCSIVLDGMEWARNQRGLNIVVVDGNRVIDSVAFDTWGEDNAIAIR